MDRRVEKRYWKSLEERDRVGEASGGEELSGLARLPFDRRGFLKAVGFGMAGALAGGCRRSPVERAIPYLVQPEEVVPGRALWYATTCGGCAAGCGVLAKCRDGRPTKLEGNPGHPLSAGGLCAVGQASVLGLYDSHRLGGPLLEGEAVGWPAVDRRVTGTLAEIARLGGRVRLLTETLSSPTEQRLIGRFLEPFADGRWVVYDPLSVSAILDAHERTHGRRLLPRYRFERAEVIVSFDADFLGTWISPVGHTRGYRAGRDLTGDPPRLSHHVQLEGRMSLTGSNADRRVVVTPEEGRAVLTRLAFLVARRAGVELGRGADAAAEPAARPGLAEELAGRLWQARGRSLVISGSQSVEEQALVNLVNHLLGNEGATLDPDRPSHQRLGSDRALAELVAQIEAGEVDALFIRGVNPVYDLPAGERLAAALARVPLVISFAGHLDETARLATAVCPEHHFLEGWRDGEPVAGLVTLAQPAIRPLGETRGFAASLAAWLGEPADDLELVRRTWQEELFPRAGADAATAGFQAFWDRSVHDGFAELAVEPPAPQPTPPRPFALEAVPPPSPPARQEDGAFTLVLYPKVGLLDGRGAENPWLQELPDPVTKVTWDNYACLAPGAAAELGVQEGDVVRLELAAGDGEASPALEPPALELPVLELPVYVQPGQHPRVVAVALGYGRAGSERFSKVGRHWFLGRPSVAEGETVGSNAAPFVAVAGGQRLYHRPGVKVTPTGATRPLASTQTHHELAVPAALAPAGGEPRPIVQETVLAAYRRDPGAGAPRGHELPEADLWPAHADPGPHWGMAVDLNACTGCSACVVACQAENNVPVVGKDEVRRRREMHWLRIDRYYSGDGREVDAVHQPMLCHHCDDAPCESVCPVLATVHSSEGLNQQVYNRCVGTRYCANNCPFKVRRFNWFDYPHGDLVENLVLNPDVVVRSRGVMEKCSFCVQRIQEGKMAARVQGRPLADGEVQPACQQSCPAGAIVFGDLADPESKVSRLAREPRSYRLLTELNIQPSVTYLRKVRHRDEAAEAGAQGDAEEVHHG